MFGFLFKQGNEFKHPWIHILFELLLLLSLRKTVECCLGNWQWLLSWLQVNITLSINKTTDWDWYSWWYTQMYRAQDQIMCERVLKERRGETLTRPSVCLLVCVCAIAESVSLRCSFWPLTPELGSSPDKWDGRVLARTANIPQQSSVLLLPSPHIRHSSPLCTPLPVSLPWLIFRES